MMELQENKYGYDYVNAEEVNEYDVEVCTCGRCGVTYIKVKGTNKPKTICKKCFYENRKKKNEGTVYIIENGVAVFVTSSGIKFTVDEEDAPRVAEYTWAMNSSGYLLACIKGKLVLLHRFILGLNSEDKILVDHIDRDKLNNCKSNLRLCNKQENAWNTDAKGYTKLPNDKYQAQIMVDGKTINLGTYDTEEQARAVRIIGGEKVYFGEYGANKDLYNDPEILRLYEEVKYEVKRLSKYNEYTINGDVVILKASNCDEEFIVDLADFERIKDYTWCVNNGYVVAWIDGEKQTLSRHLLGLKQGEKKKVKFIDGNNRNFRRDNLKVIELKTKNEDGDNK